MGGLVEDPHWHRRPSHGEQSSERDKAGEQFTVSLPFLPFLSFTVLMFLSVPAADDVSSVYWQGRVQSQ